MFYWSAYVWLNFCLSYCSCCSYYGIHFFMQLKLLSPLLCNIPLLCLCSQLQSHSQCQHPQDLQEHYHCCWNGSFWLAVTLIVCFPWFLAVFSPWCFVHRIFVYMLFVSCGLNHGFWCSPCNWMYTKSECIGHVWRKDSSLCQNLAPPWKFSFDLKEFGLSPKLSWFCLCRPSIVLPTCK